MRASPLVVVLAVILILTGCATAYQKEGITGGFSDTQLGENTFLISFQGNGYTSSVRAAEFCLLHAAEVALQHGFPYFAILDTQSDTTVMPVTMPTQQVTRTNVNVIGSYAYGRSTTTTYGGQTVMIQKPQVSVAMRGFHTPPPEEVLGFDAKFIQTAIRKKYDLD